MQTQLAALCVVAQCVNDSIERSESQVDAVLASWREPAME